MNDPRPFHEILSEAIDRRGLTLERIRWHLRRRGHDLSPAALSYWRRGLSNPTRSASFAVIEALEEILEVAPGTLTGPIEEIRGPDQPGHGDVVNELAERLGLSWDDGLRRTSVHDALVFDERGCPTRHRVRETFRAVRDGVDRFPIAFHQDDPTAVVTYEAGTNCAIGREVREDTVVLVEVLLPRALEAGDTGMSEYLVTIDGSTGSMTQWGRHTGRRLRDLHMSLRFDPTHVPVEAVLITEVKGVVREVPQVMTGASIDVHLLDFGPGVAEVRWSWGPGQDGDIDEDFDDVNGEEPDDAGPGDERHAGVVAEEPSRR